MPRIDPLQLLNCLNVLLTPKGGIKSEQEVARISSLMEKFSKKLVSKCVYLLILKSSEPHLLFKFMGLGGWNLIYNWLVHAVEAKNYPFLIELLEVILLCPVDIERLKSNPMPRQVKALSRDSDINTRVRELASDIVKHWLAIVKSTPSVTTQTATETPAPVPATEVNQRLNEVSESSAENRVKEAQASSEASAGGDEEEDETYTKSTSPSSSSLESDDSDVFVPYKKSQTRGKRKLVLKKEKSPIKKSAPEEKRKLKSKLITGTGAKGEKSGSIKLKIEVSSTNAKSKKSEEKTVEEKVKEKRRLKEEKEREKFAQFKQEREKKEKRGEKHEIDPRSKVNKVFEDKLKGELSKLIPKSLDKIGRIPKINKDKEKEREKEKEKENSAAAFDKRNQEKKPAVKIEERKPDKKDDKSNVVKEMDKSRLNHDKKEKDGKKPLPIPPPPPKKPVSISVEKRTAGEVKPKTVKAYNSKFRLTGLEQEIVSKPAARKPGSSPNPANSSPNSVSAGYEKDAIKRSPTKDIESEPAEKRLKSPEEEKSSSSPGLNKNKKPFLLESDAFMSAMDTALMTQKEQLRKRKKPIQKTDSEEKSEASTTPVRKNSDAASSPTVKTEPVETKPAFKFYKDTLETSAEEIMDTSESKEIPKEAATVEVKAESNDEENPPEKLVVAASNDPSKPRSAVGLKSSLSLFRTKKLPKKSVTWRSDDELEAVQFFEVDVTERTNVVRNFWEMQMMERTKERDMMMVRKSGDNDKMIAQTKWKPLIPIDLTPPTTVRGSNSQEKKIQYARERIIPPSLYYNKSMIPDTPAEPDLEIHPVTVPPVIPLDDITGSQDSITDFSALKWPEPKQFAPDNMDMNAIKGFIPGMPPPIFPPFPDGTFPPPFAQPFFPGGAVPPMPVPNTWNAGSTDSSQPSSTTSVPWVPPGVVPPPGMMGPPPFGMMGPFPPIPGAGFPPNMFPMNNTVATTESNTTPSNTENQYSNSNTNYSASGAKDNNTSGGSSSRSDGGSKKWYNDDQYWSKKDSYNKDSYNKDSYNKDSYSKKDNWRNNNSDRNKRGGSGSWRGSGGNSRLCRIFQKKGFCNVSGCRFYHPDKS